MELVGKKLCFIFCCHFLQQLLASFCEIGTWETKKSVFQKFCVCFATSVIKDSHVVFCKLHLCFGENLHIFTPNNTDFFDESRLGCAEFVFFLRPKTSV